MRIALYNTIILGQTIIMTFTPFVILGKKEFDFGNFFASDSHSFLLFTIPLISIVTHVIMFTSIPLRKMMFAVYDDATYTHCYCWFVSSAGIVIYTSNLLAVEALVLSFTSGAVWATSYAFSSVFMSKRK